MSDVVDQSGARKVIVVTDRVAGDWLEPLVAQWVRDRIVWIAVVGPDCVAIEEHIDELVIGDGLDRGLFVMTTSHPNETLDDVTDFMLSLVGEYEGDVAIVEA